MRMQLGLKVVLAALLGVAVSGGGCANKTQTGALVGGLGGAAVGAGIGSVSHGRAGAGALIGGAVGAIGGALIGNSMDKQDEEQRQRDEARATRESGRARISESAPITKQEIISWSSHGTKDDVIIDRIDRSGAVFHLTAADENRLRDAGVSEQVIRAMKDTARQ